ncbi:MAG TPA: hypothetical protein VF401_01585 [Candidatus Saccharimonadales bacterium]
MEGERPALGPELSIHEQIKQGIDTFEAFIALSNSEGDSAAIKQRIPEMERALNSLWYQTGMMDECCVVTGYGIRPERVIEALESEADDSDAEGDTISEDGNQEQGPLYRLSTDEINQDYAYSQGFTVVDFFGNGEYALWHKFLINQEEIVHHPLIKDTRNVYMYVRATTMQCIPQTAFEDLDPLRFYTQALDIVNENRQVEVLNRFSNDVVRLIHSKYFRRHDTGPVQLRKVERIIQKAELTTAIKGSQILAEPQLIYRPVFEDGQLVYEPIPLENISLGGLCMGLDVIGKQALAEQPLRYVKDLPQAQDGLSVIVELDDEGNLASDLDAAGLAVEEVVYIPLSSQSFDAIIFPPEAVEMAIQDRLEERGLRMEPEPPRY